MRFLGYPIFEGLTLWMSHGEASRPSGRPAERWNRRKNDKKTWIFICGAA